MKSKTILALIALMAVATHSQAFTSSLPAALPDFMDKSELNQWSVGQTALIPYACIVGSDQFYTGKPYVADVGGYAYKYRTYNPDISRWTSSDPSGFPNGVNNRIYGGSPLSGVDSDGLTYSKITVSYSSSSNIKDWQSTGTVSYTPTGGAAGTYYTAAQVEVDPSNSPFSSAGGTISVTGTTWLSPTSKSDTNQLLTTTSDGFNVALNAATGIITLSQTGGSSPNSDGALINTLTDTIATNSEKTDTIKVSIAASGDGAAGGYIIVKLTAE